MSAEQRITVRVRPDGTVEAMTHGVKGTHCLGYVGVLEELIAAKAIDSHFTYEFYEYAGEQDSVRTEENVRLEAPPP